MHKKARLEMLYYENKVGSKMNWDASKFLDEIAVSVRRWSTNDGEKSDMVLRFSSRVSGTTELDECTVLDPHLSSMGAIRHAMGLFDKLVKAHSVLGQGGPEPD